MGLWNGRVTRDCGSFFPFGGGGVDDGFFKSLEWKNSIKHDHILLISLSIFRIYGIKKVEFLLLRRLR